MLHYSITFVLALAVYTKTLMPSIPGGDSGELVAEACELGTAHPPGYPLYTLVVHLLTYLPYGTMAWRANEFCAILGALAAANIADCVFMLTSNTFSMLPSLFQNTTVRLRRMASICAGLMYAFSPLVWTYSVGSEVFAMNNFFSSLLIVLTICFAKQKTTRDRFSFALLGAFVCGISMCNQHTQILFQIPLFVFVFWTLRATLQGKQVLFLALSYIAGLLPYLYLPISSIYFPKRGAWGDMSSWTGFFRHLRRADYGTFQLYSGGGTTEGLMARLSAHSWDYAERQSLWCMGPLFSLLGCGCCLSVVRQGKCWCCGRGSGSGGKGTSGNSGLASIRKLNQQKKSKQQSQGGSNSDGKNKVAADAAAPETAAAAAGTEDMDLSSQPIDIGAAIACFFLFYELGFHSLSNLPLNNKLLFGIHARFWMQPNVILFIWFGIGLIRSLEWVTRYIGGGKSGGGKNGGNSDGGNSGKNSGGNSGGPLFDLLHGVLCMALVVGQIWRWSEDMDQSSNRYLEQYARGILESLPPKSLFFTNYDQQWTASRYLHVCEHVRPDIPFINLSMMTFWWFYRQRKLFPEIQFPKRCTNDACGAYLGGDHTPQYKRGEAFTFKELLDANMDRFPGGTWRNSGVVVCGLFWTLVCWIVLCFPFINFSPLVHSCPVLLLPSTVLFVRTGRHLHWW
jgi:hypothetical protein